MVKNSKVLYQDVEFYKGNKSSGGFVFGETVYFFVSGLYIVLYGVVYGILDAEKA